MIDSPPVKRDTMRRTRVLLRRHGPTAPVWRGRAAIIGGAVFVGLAAISFAWLADRANELFHLLVTHCWWLPLLVTPAGYVLIIWITNRLAPAARGSGIPQIIAAKRDPAGAMADLTSGRTAVLKAVLTAGALTIGASVGREGPTVQLGATIMAYAHRLLRVPLNASVLVAGAAAGVAAAFNTPLAGVAFAIEELAAAYEQRMTLLVMTAVLIAGMVAQGVAGDYVYFGIVGQTLPFTSVLIVAPVAGVLGGAFGGLFSRLTLWFARGGASRISGGRPLLLAGVCGLIVAGIGVASGMTWGTGYGAARAIIEGHDAPLSFGAAKFVSTLATAAAGLPGGIFAPSLATGAGLGNLLHALFPNEPTGALVLLAMAGYFTGVVRAPLTAVIIMSETTGSRGLMLPLLATALIAEPVASLVCRERLYHGLSMGFLRPR
ncbi:MULTISPECIES: chloride channel protein [unclassified Sphingomonas]|uniref:chloride channel protein n=1 Tax=unclassified Sphingomonas TaxID=196159 RepID=UPI0009258AD6|nr:MULTISPECIES: chloride channel protein [unclassified Sphingomonas]MBN8847504.1 chloride channel protein [Sphingomonas sp.]OJV32687.1 MAG: chloride channel protein [Sphingomonas sp. 67-36]